MIQRSRIPAAAILFIVLAVGVFFLGFTRRNSGSDAAALLELQKAAVQPNAKPAAWLEYASKLQEAGQFPRAVAAYQHLLELDPYNREVRLQCAACLAQLGNSDELFTFLRATLQVNPKLTLNIIGRPEIGRFLAESRYQTLQQEAVAQSMD